MKNFINEWKPAIFNSTIYSLFAISLFFVTVDQAILLILIGMVSSTLGNAILLHRFYTHKQFNLGRTTEYLLLPFAIIIGIGSPIMYATIHRQHHRVCDQLGDPHSPSKLGKWKVFTGLWEFFPATYFRNLNAPVARDLLVNPVQRIVHVYYYRIWFLGFAVTCLISWQWAVALFGWIPVYQKVIENIVVNGICHPGPDILDWPQFGIFTGGESMQKLHHGRPQDIKYSNNWLVDPAWPIIRMIQK